jgi:hypothetical protein
LSVITACICFYNAKMELERCLESLDLGKKRKGGIDFAICVDGKYPNFVGNSKVSNDGSLDVVKSFPNTLLVTKPDYEIHKRNFYLQASEFTNPQTDYILIIDSDEYIDNDTKDWKLFRANLANLHGKNPGRDIWGVEIESNSDDYVETVEQILGRPYQKKKRHSYDLQEFQPKPRIWYKPWQFEYHLNHYTWRHKDINYPEYLRESVFGVTMWDTIKGISLLHDHKLRSQNYLDKRLDYHRWLIQFEQTKVRHYFKHHNYKPLPHNLAKVEQWFDDNDILLNSARVK